MTISELYKSLNLKAGGEKNPVDLIYDETPTKFIKMNSESDEVNLAKEMIKTMGPTHKNFELEVIECYRLNNDTQKAENWAFRNVKSRLLWLGARKTEFAHILT